MHKITADTSIVVSDRQYYTLRVIATQETKKTIDVYEMERADLVMLAKLILANHTKYSYEQLTEVLG